MHLEREFDNMYLYKRPRDGSRSVAGYHTRDVNEVKGKDEE